MVYPVNKASSSLKPVLDKKSHTIIIRTPDGQPPTDAVFREVLSQAGLPRDLPKNSDKILYRAIADEDRHQLSYQRRIEISGRSAKYMLDTLESGKSLKPPFKTPGDLRQHLNDLQEKYLIELTKVKNKSDVKAYQRIFERYLRQTQFSFCHATGMSANEFQSRLAKAEEYVTFEFGRPILATVTPHEVKLANGQIRSGTVIQMEVPQAPLSNRMLNEYITAARSYPYSEGNAEVPDWFRVLSSYEKQCFYKTFSDISGLGRGEDFTKPTDEQAKDYMKAKVGGLTMEQQSTPGSVAALSSKHRTIPGVANFSLHKAAMLDEQAQVVDEWQRYRSSKFASRDVKGELQKIRDDHAAHNFHQIVSLALIQKFGEDRLARGEVNVEELAQVPILMQTLITPIKTVKDVDYQTYLDKERVIHYFRDNDFRLRVGDQVISFRLNLYDTNHALNIGRHVLPTVDEGSEKSLIVHTKVGEQTSAQARKLVDDALVYVKEQRARVNLSPKEQRDLDIISKSASNLGQLLNQPPRYTDQQDNQRELYLASLEQIIVTHMGGVAYGSCISGKDRKGLETAHTDAMEIYFRLYNHLPPFESGPERDQFIDIFVDIYRSRHQQMNAGQNALGADGIKTPQGYLPKDMQLAIQRAYDLTHPTYHSPHVLKDSDQLASNNELNKVIAGESATDKFLGKAAKLVTGKASEKSVTAHLSDTDMVEFNRDMSRSCKGETLVNESQAHAVSSRNIMEQLVGPHHEPADKSVTNEMRAKLLNDMHSVIGSRRFDSGAKYTGGTTAGVKELRSKVSEHLPLSPSTKAISKTLDRNTQINVLELVGEVTSKRLHGDSQDRDITVHELYKILHSITAEVLSAEEGSTLSEATLENIARLEQMASEVITDPAPGSPEGGGRLSGWFKSSVKS